MVKVHESLKAWRLRLNLSQAQAAARAGMSQSRWCLIEGGKCTPTLHQALGIQRATRGEIRVDMWPMPVRRRAA